MLRRPMPLWSDPGEVDDTLDGAELPKDIVERRAALRPEGERAAHEVVAVAGIGVQLQLRECAVLFPREADDREDSDLVPDGVDDPLVRVALKRAGQADDGVDALNARKQQGNAHVDHQRRRAVEGVEDHQHA